MNTFYLPLLLLSVFAYAASGTCEVLDRMGENETVARKAIGFISSLGLVVWPLWIAAFFLAVKWWHIPVLFFSSVFGVKLYDFVIGFVGLAGEGISRAWLYVSSLAVIPLLVWTAFAMYEAYAFLYN